MVYLDDCFVNATPGEIINEAGFSASLHDGCKGGYPESGEVEDRLEEKEGDMACL